MKEPTPIATQLTRCAMWIRVSIVTVVLAVASTPAEALADGDPASDVLVSQPLFLPQDAAIPRTQQVQLDALLAAAAHTGYSIRVAIIASPVDLGTIPELWRKPQSYAPFLGQELSVVYKGPLLVVMPGGYGAYRVSRRGASELRRLRPPGSALGAGALLAIRRLAAASGRQLPLVSGNPSSVNGSGNTVPWLIFAAGCIVVAAAWSASLRVRPLRALSRR